MSKYYLVRWDDISPFLQQAKFDRLVTLFQKYGAKAVLGVIPDNRSEHVKFDTMAEPEFIRRIHKLQAAGWEIALHGDTHEQLSKEGGILKINSASEFAGLTLAKQETKIKHALGIMRGWNLKPSTFIAPWHSFDANTLQVLKKEGITIISDGFGLLPRLSSGLFHIPQIAWRPLKVPFGVVTICLHPNTMKEAQFKEMERFLEKSANKIVTCEEYQKLNPHPTKIGGAVNTVVNYLIRFLLARRKR